MTTPQWGRGKEGDKPGEWIATVTAECAIHGITETWGAWGATAAEAQQKLDDTKANFIVGDHELATWEPQVGRVFELPPRLADPPPAERDPVEDAATAVYAQIEDLTPDDRLLVLRMAISAEEHTADLCEACAEPIAEGYESPNNDSANGIRFCANCTRLEDEEIAVEARRHEDEEILAEQNAAPRTRAYIDADLRRVGDQLRNHANALALDMTSLLDDLKLGFKVHEPGVCQGHGSAVDRLCGQRHTLIEIKRTLEGRP